MTTKPEAIGLGPGKPIAAFDVGGTDIKAALVDAGGTVRGVRRMPTPRDAARPAEAVLEAVTAIMAALVEENPDIRSEAVGLVVPGVVDEQAGVGIHSENLGWRDAPFRERGESLLGLPVSVGHDVRAAGEAEKSLGAARPYDDVMVMVIGTGISAAVFCGGRLHDGGGYAGEIGHLMVEPGGPACACGSAGCLEAVASAAAIARRYAQLSGIAVEGARQVVARMREGDATATRVWHLAVDSLARALAATATVLAPEAVVIGGGLSHAGEDLFEPLRRRLDATLTFQRRPALLPALIGEDAGLVGAALRARRGAETGAPR